MNTNVMVCPKCFGPAVWNNHFKIRKFICQNSKCGWNGDSGLNNHYTLNEIIQIICSIIPSSIDEDIPDDDKEAAYTKGYTDAIEDMVGTLKKNGKGRSHELSLRKKRNSL